jgi:hypothetical protein
MELRRALMLAFLLTPIAAMAQQRRQKETAPRPLASLDETKAALKAFRELGSRTSSGMNVDAYSAAIADLKVTVDALDEVLEARKESALRQQLAAAFGVYQDAKTIWAGCVSYCDSGILVLDHPGDPLERFAASIVEANAEMARPISDGGVLMPGGGRRVHYVRLVGALMADGRLKYEALRASLLSR